MPTRNSSSEVSREGVVLLLVSLTRYPSLFRSLSISLTSADFEQESDIAYMMLLEAYFKDQDTPPSRGDLEGLIDDLAEDYDAFQNDFVIDDIHAVMKRAYSSKFRPEMFEDEKKLGIRVAKLAKKVLLGRAKTQIPYQIEECSSKVLAEILQQSYESVRSIESIDVTREPDLAFPVDGSWAKSNLYETHPTGITVMDRLLNGGICNYEVVGFLAPYGTCKTTTAAHLGAAGSRQCFEVYVNHLTELPEERPVGLNFVVVYEADKTEMQYRMIQNAALVHADSLRAMADVGLDALSGPGEPPKPYELEMFQAEILAGTFESERERVDRAVQMLNQHCVLLDFSSERGDKGVPEIAAAIQREISVRKGKCYVHRVMLDYVGLMVTRYMMANPKIHESQETNLITAVPNAVKRLICKPFNTHAILFHQLSGTANASSKSIKLPDKADAIGSRSFSENCAYALVTSNLTQDDERVGLMQAQKTRRSAPVRPVVFRVDGPFCRLEETQSHFCSTGNVLVPKDMGVAVDDDDTHSSLEALQSLPDTDDFIP